MKIFTTPVTDTTVFDSSTDRNGYFSPKSGISITRKNTTFSLDEAIFIKPVVSSGTTYKPNTLFFDSGISFTSTSDTNLGRASLIFSYTGVPLTSHTLCLEPVNRAVKWNLTVKNMLPGATMDITGVFEADSLILGNISSFSGGRYLANLSVTAENRKGLLTVSGYSAASIKTNGNIAGTTAVSAATGSAGQGLTARAFQASGILTLDTVSGGITVKASENQKSTDGGTGTFFGAGIYSGETVTAFVISGKISVSGTVRGGDDTDATAILSSWRAAGIDAVNTITAGTLSGGITVSVSGIKSVSAAGLYSGGSVAVDLLTGKMTASASSLGTASAAYDICSVSGNIVVRTLSGALTANAKAADAADAVALSAAVGGITVTGDYASTTAVSAASARAGTHAAALECSELLRIFGNLAGDVSVSASGSTGSRAFAIHSTGKGVTVSGDLNARISVTAKDSTDALAQALNGTGITIGRIRKDISVSADGAAGSSAGGLSSSASNIITGDISAVISVRALSRTSSSTGWGFYSMGSGGISTGNISGKITVSASGDASSGAFGILSTGGISSSVSGTVSINAIGKTATARAYGFAAGEIALDKVSGTVSVDALSKDKATVIGIFSNAAGIAAGTFSGALRTSAASTAGVAAVEGIHASTTLTFSEEVSGNVTAAADAYGSAYATGITALANAGIRALKGITGTVAVTSRSASGAASASGILGYLLNAEKIGTLDIRSSAASSGKATAAGFSFVDIAAGGMERVTVAASSAKGNAEATGLIASSSLSFNTLLTDIGTWNITATGGASASATGWFIGTASGPFSSVSNSEVTGRMTVTAKGGSSGSAVGIFCKNMGDIRMKVDITAFGIDQAAAYDLVESGKLSIGKSKVTAGGSSRTGSFFAIRGAAGEQDAVLYEGASLTGDVDLGGDSDSIAIHSGASLRGNIYNTETITFDLDDPEGSAVPLWEASSLSGTPSVAIEVNNGLMGSFTLFRGSAGSVNSSGIFGTVGMRLAASPGTVHTLTLNGSTLIDGIRYSLSSSDGRTLKLGIAVG